MVAAAPELARRRPDLELVHQTGERDLARGSRGIRADGRGGTERRLPGRRGRRDDGGRFGHLARRRDGAGGTRGGGPAGDSRAVPRGDRRPPAQERARGRRRGRRGGDRRDGDLRAATGRGRRRAARRLVEIGGDEPRDARRWRARTRPPASSIGCSNWRVVEMLGRTRRVHFVGIGGIGMSGIAELLVNLGYSVTGSDLRRSELTDRLASLGVAIFGRARRAQSRRRRRRRRVVRGARRQPRSRGRPRQARARHPARGDAGRAHAVCAWGSRLPARMGRQRRPRWWRGCSSAPGLDPTAVIGGRLSAFGSNARLGRGQYMVAEADESDRSFLKLSPTIAVLTNIDREHMEAYGTFDRLVDAFARFRRPRAVLRRGHRVQGRRAGRGPAAAAGPADRDLRIRRGCGRSRRRSRQRRPVGTLRGQVSGPRCRRRHRRGHAHAGRARPPQSSERAWRRSPSDSKSACRSSVSSPRSPSSAAPSVAIRSAGSVNGVTRRRRLRSSSDRDRRGAASGARRPADAPRRGVPATSIQPHTRPARRVRSGACAGRRSRAARHLPGG